MVLYDAMMLVATKFVWQPICNATRAAHALRSAIFLLINSWIVCYRAFQKALQKRFASNAGDIWPERDHPGDDVDKDGQVGEDHPVD